MEITVDLEKLSVDTRKLLACELTDPADLLLLAIDKSSSVRDVVAQNTSISKDIIYILSRDEDKSVILDLLKNHQLEKEDIIYLAKAFQYYQSRYSIDVKEIKIALIRQDNISSEAIAIMLEGDSYSDLMYSATGIDQISSDTLKMIIKKTDSSLIASRALKHPNTRYEDIEEFIFSHKYNFDYDFCVAKFYLSHSGTSSKSIYNFAKYLIKQYMDSNKKGQTSFEHILIEIVANPKTDSKTLFWLVTETRKKSLLCDSNMLKKLKKALESNPNVTESILWEVSPDEAITVI